MRGLAADATPGSTAFCTVGDGHVAFWRMSSGQLKGAPAQACTDCNLCAVLQARHEASLALLRAEMAKPPRYTALRCLMRTPPVNKWPFACTRARHGLDS